MKTTMLVLSLCAALSGCASPYQSNGFGGGFSEMQMAQDTYRIQFRGNAFTGADATSEMAILRAAELTLQSGYSHFVIMGAGDSTDRSYYAQPGVTTTSIRPTYAGGYNATSTSSGGVITPIDKPRSEIIVKMHNAGEGNGMDAQQVYERLAPKYKGS